MLLLWYGYITIFFFSYLTQSFYEANFNIQQRIDILTVLQETALYLSNNTTTIYSATTTTTSSVNNNSKVIENQKQKQPSLKYGQENSNIKNNNNNSSNNNNGNNSKLSPRDIIQSRIELNTRRWGSRSRKNKIQEEEESTKGKKNKFISIAGLFFFPLIRYNDSNVHDQQQYA